ncbi:aminotransferase class IV family protein [Marivivens sp. JLT3646]|uniref:aminotransferase class IV family protein n=1 Tax=Marivivens sp. JLT3646 TaxID=1920883 RepID=UPI0007FE2590|nr:aminotransferase class IV family protein [Marivivens sp. JLT3646]APO87707.1 hypothetical protein BSK21_12100 [Marivivens sp. JLT3646]OBR36287.1 hypothetical protein A9199_08425 [Donghicola sp. JL3646]
MESALRTDRPKDLLLIETMGRGADGIRYLDLHLARLKRGAEALGYPFDESQVRSALADAAEGHERIRLTLNEAGNTVVETGHLPPNPPHWTVAVHSIRLNSDDPWLQVKTTNRALYNDARADLPNGVDEWLFLNERDEVCEGTITNIFVVLEDGRRVTPPLTSGLLPGVLRQSLIQNGCEEQVLTLSDLSKAREIHMGNALRGLIRVQLAPFA